MIKLSIIVPVYNEINTIEHVISIVGAVPVDKEIIIVDDGSSDGTQEVLRKKILNKSGAKVIFQEKNQGKGRAIRTGIAAASGEAIIIQDADMEYDPMDYLVLLKALEEQKGNVVYGSRFLNKKNVTSFWHRGVNFFLTALTNILYGSNLTDMETCYKLYRTNTLKKILLVSNGFEIEVELAAKTLKSGEKIMEVPISYKGRSFHEGKKIGWKDGLKAVFALFRYRFSPPS